MEDVESFLQARWNGLVRTLVVSGCTVEEAEQVATTACARTWPAWRVAHKREEDVDVLVYSVLLEERGRGWARQHPDRAVAGAARLTAALTQGAGLDDYQVEQVLRGVPGAADARTGGAGVIAQEWDDVYRAPAPLAAIRQVVRRTRRRRVVAGAGVLAATLVATAVVLVTRPDAPAPPEPPAPQNPIAIAWWSNGVLHLDGADIDAPGLVSLAQAGEAPYSAVYGDDTGRVFQVGPDGEVAAVGRTRPGDPIVGAADGTAAWVEPGRVADRGVRRDPGGGARLVAWDTAAGAEVGSVTVERTTRLVAIDDGTVFAVSASDDTVGLSWLIGDATVGQIDGGLLDVVGGVELRSAVARPFVIPFGQPARLSPDGSLALTWRSGGTSAVLVSPGTPPGTSPSATPVIALGSRAVVLDGRFTPDGDVVLVRVYLVSMGRDDGSGSSGRSPYADLITCSTEDGSCEISVGRNTFAGDSSGPTPIILAR